MHSVSSHKTDSIRLRRARTTSGSKVRNRLVSAASSPATTSTRPLRLDDLLDQVHEVLAIENADPVQWQSAVDTLFRGLRSLRAEADPAVWQEMIAQGRQHPVRALVHQDPFTSRAFQKPRGYAGDAVMMDYIYGREENWPRPGATAVGDAIYQYTTAAPASSGVRERRCYIAELLDRLGRQAPGQHALAVASGHLREAGVSTAIRRGCFERFVAMDADAESLQVVQNDYGAYGVETQETNVRRLLTGRMDLGEFDLIYSTGLYDYLADNTAQRLTASLFDALRPGGRLVLANFLPQIRDVGYMEMFMDWHLIYRTRGDMLRLADELEQPSVGEIRVIAERNENVVIMEMIKR
ncbi:class I SAM-dependent methyltransferase [Roseimaritima sediminicola]|uniref:class I SAM-dependent methyltransferase n=1 Tax=Roseimaritima sediminicola TaxID=2662066 RepID=UPI001298426B|nr:class I SAM-dependent methyltransferase [Roseimaritima sediminicola]